MREVKYTASGHPLTAFMLNPLRVNDNVGEQLRGAFLHQDLYRSRIFQTFM
jgi:hypothetical protein